MGMAIKHPVPDRVKLSFVISNIRQSARMSKITNYVLTRSGTGCFIAVYPYGNSGRQRVKNDKLSMISLKQLRFEKLDADCYSLVVRQKMAI